MSDTNNVNVPSPTPRVTRKALAGGFHWQFFVNGAKARRAKHCYEFARVAGSRVLSYHATRKAAEAAQREAQKSAAYWANAADAAIRASGGGFTEGHYDRIRRQTAAEARAVIVAVEAVGGAS